jgi:cbb3-type cytochrome oxidase subunit 3
MPLLASSGGAALDAIVVAAMIVPIPVLGVICWIFWRAKQREEHEAAAVRQQPPRG